MPPPTPPRVLLLGGGHVHAPLLLRLTARPLPGAAAVTLVARTRLTPYSGALPALLEGAVPQRDALIDVEALAAAAGATFVCGEAVGVDAEGGRVTLASGAALSYDLLSLDVGGAAPRVALPGAAAAGAVDVRPLDGAPERLAGLLRSIDAAAAGDDGRAPPLSLVVVGGGAAGVEVAAALAARGRRSGRVRVALAAGARLLPAAPAAARAAVAGELARAGVAVDESGPVVAFEAARAGGGGGFEAVTAAGARLPFARGAAVLCLPAAPPAWLASTGLAVDDAGFLATDAACECWLAGGGGEEAAGAARRRPRARVFAAGDCASPATAPPLPKAGVHAVRAAPVLEASLRAAVAGEEGGGAGARRPALAARAALALVGVGRGRAVAVRPGLPQLPAGGWVWAWKRWLDGRYVDRFRGKEGERDG